MTHQRRAAKPHSALLANAKSAWSRARQKTISKEERASQITSLMEIVRGMIQDIVFKHDASRIVQTIVKRGNQRQRDEVATELRGRFKELVENKYSKVRCIDGLPRSKLNVFQFLVAKLAQFCPSHRLSMITEFRSHVIRLLLHREASQIIADIYDLYANATERAILLRDFYGREVALLPLPSKGEDAKKDGRGGLSVVLQEASGEQRRRILASLSENLNLMLAHSLFRSFCPLPWIAGSTTPTRVLSDTQLFTGHCGNTYRKQQTLRKGSAKKCFKTYLRGFSSHPFVSCLLTGTQLQRLACRDGTY
jgi:pumilio homology domain family member 6